MPTKKNNKKDPQSPTHPFSSPTFNFLSPNKLISLKMVKVISTLLVAATLAVASFTTAAPVKKANATAEPKVKAASSDFSGKATWCKFYILLYSHFSP
jgi:hypothetical protein